MTFGQWLLSPYYNRGMFYNDANIIANLQLDPSYSEILISGAGMEYTPLIRTNEPIIPNQVYFIETNQ